MRVDEVEFKVSLEYWDWIPGIMAKYKNEQSQMEANEVLLIGVKIDSSNRI